MVDVRHLLREHLIEEQGGVRLTYADTGLLASNRFAAAGVSYRRPVRVTMTGSGVTVPIRDHVMIVRLSVAAFLVVVNVWRRQHGR